MSVDAEASRSATKLEQDECSSSDADTDSESDIDEEECNNRKFTVLRDIVDLEKQFQIVKDSMYAEKSRELDQRLYELHSGVDAEYKAKLAGFEAERLAVTSQCELQQRLEEDSIRAVSDGEENAAVQCYEEKKRILFEHMREDLEERINKRRNEHEQASRCLDFWLAESSRKKQSLRGSKRSGRRSPHAMFELEKRKKPLLMSGPYVVYMLQEPDIIDDWKRIGSLLPVSSEVS